MKEWGYAPGIDKQGEIERPVGLLETGSSKGRTGGVGVRTQCCGAVVVISGLFFIGSEQCNLQVEASIHGDWSWSRNKIH